MNTPVSLEEETTPQHPVADWPRRGRVLVYLLLLLITGALAHWGDPGGVDGSPTTSVANDASADRASRVIRPPSDKSKARAAKVQRCGLFLGARGEVLNGIQACNHLA